MNSPRLLRFPSTQTADSDDCSAFPLLVGASKAAVRLRAQLSRVAPYFRAVLLTGAAGSGVEDAARMLHSGSASHRLPLRKLSAEAAETYFTQNPSTVRAVLFLEDAEALSPAAQRGLLRWMRLRGAEPARVIAAAETDLRGRVSAGEFSAELAGRLSGLRIALPSLRERAEDIPGLLQGMLSNIEGVPHAATMSEEFLQAACHYSWPRNLLELAEYVEWLRENRADREWQGEDFHAACDACAQVKAGEAGQVRMIRLEAVVQEHLRAVLAGCFGNKQKAAEVLGISRSTLYRMLDAGNGGFAQAS